MHKLNHTGHLHTIERLSAEPVCKKTNCANSVKNSSAHLCPDAVAMGEGPLGGRGSSQVLISISTLSSVCKQVMDLKSFVVVHRATVLIGDADSFMITLTGGKY